MGSRSSGRGSPGLLSALSSPSPHLCGADVCFASAIVDPLYNSVRTASDTLDSSPFTVLLKISHRNFVRYCSAAGVDASAVLSAAPESEEHATLCSLISSHIFAEPIYYDGQQPYLFTEDFPHKKAADPIDVGVWKIEDGKRAPKDVSGGSGVLITLGVSRQFPLSSAHAGSAFRLGLMLLVPRSSKKGPASKQSAASLANTGKTESVEAVSPGSRNKALAGRVPDSEPSTAAVSEPQFDTVFCFSNAFKVLAKQGKHGTHAKQIHYPSFERLPKDRESRIRAIMLAGSTMKSTLQRFLQFPDPITIDAGGAPVPPGSKLEDAALAAATALASKKAAEAAFLASPGGASAAAGSGSGSGSAAGDGNFQQAVAPSSSTVQLEGRQPSAAAASAADAAPGQSTPLPPEQSNIEIAGAVEYPVPSDLKKRKKYPIQLPTTGGSDKVPAASTRYGQPSTSGGSAADESEEFDYYAGVQPKRSRRAAAEAAVHTIRNANAQGDAVEEMLKQSERRRSGRSARNNNTQNAAMQLQAQQQTSLIGQSSAATQSGVTRGRTSQRGPSEAGTAGASGTSSRGSSSRSSRGSTNASGSRSGAGNIITIGGKDTNEDTESEAGFGVPDGGNGGAASRQRHQQQRALPGFSPGNIGASLSGLTPSGTDAGNDDNNSNDSNRLGDGSLAFTSGQLGPQGLPVPVTAGADVMSQLMIRSGRAGAAAGAGLRSSFGQPSALQPLGTPSPYMSSQLSQMLPAPIRGPGRGGTQSSALPMSVSITPQALPALGYSGSDLQLAPSPPLPLQSSQSSELGLGAITGVAAGGGGAGMGMAGGVRPFNGDTNATTTLSPLQPLQFNRQGQAGVLASIPSLGLGASTSDGGGVGGSLSSSRFPYQPPPSSASSSLRSASLGFGLSTGGNDSSGGNMPTSGGGGAHAATLDSQDATPAHRNASSASSPGQPSNLATLQTDWNRQQSFGAEQDAALSLLGGSGSTLSDASAASRLAAGPQQQQQAVRPQGGGNDAMKLDPTSIINAGSMTTRGGVVSKDAASAATSASGGGTGSGMSLGPSISEGMYNYGSSYSFGPSTSSASFSSVLPIPYPAAVVPASSAAAQAGLSCGVGGDGAGKSIAGLAMRISDVQQHGSGGGGGGNAGALGGAAPGEGLSVPFPILGTSTSNDFRISDAVIDGSSFNTPNPAMMLINSSNGNTSIAGASPGGDVTMSKGEASDGDGFRGGAGSAYQYLPQYAVSAAAGGGTGTSSLSPSSTPPGGSAPMDIGDSSTPATRLPYTSASTGQYVPTL